MRADLERTNEARLEATETRFGDCGQSHVFRFWERLGVAEQRRLLDQAERLADGLPLWTQAWRDSRDTEPMPAESLAPFEGAIALPRSGAEQQAASEAFEVGEDLLRAGQVGVMVVAGGQGTRLGFSGPKGAFPVGPVSGRTLFELQAQKIRGLARRYGRPVAWYVMTSAATDAATRSLFEANDYFGVDPDDVLIFSQGMAPAFDSNGRVLLESMDRIFESPDGHGGSIPALAKSGALADMEARGIDTVFYYQVDNPLIRMADPGFLGFHRQAQAEVSCKVVRKQDPMAKWGVVALQGGQPSVVEYTELGDEERFARGSDGALCYWAGNIAIHAFDTKFLRRVEADAGRVLPYHVSAKKIPTVDDQGQAVSPSEPNGEKLERFVFDVLREASGVCVVEVDAAQEFSPIKNAEGAESPETARRDLVAVYRSWLESSEVPLPPGTPWIEIDHSEIDSADEARQRSFGPLDDANEAVLFGTGA